MCGRETILGTGVWSYLYSSVRNPVIVEYREAESIEIEYEHCPHHTSGEPHEFFIP